MVKNQPKVNAHHTLLGEPDVLAWYKEISLVHNVRAEDYLRRLHRYCRAIGVTPAKLVARAKDENGGRKGVERQFQAFAALLRAPHKPEDHGQANEHGVKPEKCAKGHPASYVGNYGKTLRSYMAFQDIALRRIPLGDQDAAPTLEGVPLLTKVNVRTALRAADLRGRVVIAVRAWTGLRPEVLGKPDASDGLILRDLPELRIKEGVVTFDRTPTVVLVRRALSKIHRPEVKFLPPEACTLLKEYLEHRALNGEELGPDSAIVTSDRYSATKFLETQSLSRIVKEALVAAGVPNRAYDLRNYFIMGLEAAEHDGKLTHADKEFFIGRKKEIDAKYTKFRVLPPEVVERLRETYKACEPYLGARAETLVATEAPDVGAIADAIAQEVWKRLIPDGVVVGIPSAWDQGRVPSLPEMIEAAMGKRKTVHAEQP